MPTKPRNNTVLYGSLILLQCLLWGIGNPVGKISLETMPPFLCMAIRYSIAFVLFLLFFYRKIRAQFRKEHIPNSIVVGLFTAASFTFSTLALKYAEATIVGFLLSLTVVFTPILSFFILRQKAGKKLIVIILIAVVGLYFLCGNGGSFSFGLGEIYALLSALTGAGMLTYSSKHVSDMGPMALSTAQSAVTAIVSLAFALIFEDFHSLAHVSAEGWWSVLYLAVACTCVAYSLQNIALSRVSATFVSLAFCTEPIFTVIASFFLLGERLSLIGFIGAALIVVGIVLASLGSNQGSKKEDS
ncbi:MAG: DMT family transporter [Firmicutes bacterium]|jgi:drug/metabolite transporter (DMT)-like permease|nr:DMT family transporter [Bacillota bacterium]